MESLVNYGSDDESGDYNDVGKNEVRNRQKSEEDANYDEIGMDESSEESNNNHEEGGGGHFPTLTRDKQDEASSKSCDGFKEDEREYHSDNFDADGESNSKPENDESQTSSERSNSKEEGGKRENSQEGREKYADALGERKAEKMNHAWPEIKSKKYEGINKPVKYPLAYGSRSEDSSRRHSSDMEMDDGEDDLNNFKAEETTADFRQKFSHKTINFTKGKSLGEELGRKFEDGYHDSAARSRSSPKDSRSVRENFNYDDRGADERMRPRERGKDSEERRKDDYRRRDDRDGRKRDDDRLRDSDRDRRRDGEKYRDDRDRKRTPDRRDYGRKRSHSPDRRDRDRDYDRDRDRDRERDRDRDRDRDYRDRRSPKHSRRSSRSPDRSWKARKLEKKAAVLNKLGIELKGDVTGNMTPRQLLGEQLKAQIQEVEAKTGVTLPTYYNPGVMNPLKYAQQIQKRKLLWGNKGNETKAAEGASQAASASSTVKQWEAATFKGDSDGKMTEKFKRLMGIKGDNAAANTVSASSKPPETKEIIQKQEEMFSNMEAQYQVARMATHTHRGVGLGFGTFQVPPR